MAGLDIFNYSSSMIHGAAAVTVVAVVEVVIFLLEDNTTIFLFIQVPGLCEFSHIARRSRRSIRLTVTLWPCCRA